MPQYIDHSVNSIVGWSFSQTKPRDGSAPKPFLRVDVMIGGVKQSCRIYGTPEEVAPVMREIGLSCALPNPITIKEHQTDRINERTGQPFVNYYLQSKAGYELSQRQKAGAPPAPSAPPQGYGPPAGFQQQQPMAAPVPPPPGAYQEQHGYAPAQDELPHMPAAQAPEPFNGQF